ncbi:MAG: TIGR01777 family oxidoreductase [Candidatus Nanopelagicales bacterium]|nr:TIGR01777 family oxidoreductase [Candidatus Nanopelagicales bacterium]
MAYESHDAQPAVAVTGSRGLIGSALCEALAADGVRIVRLVRPGPSGVEPDPDDSAPETITEVSWDPAAEWVDLDRLRRARVTAIVHLAGAGVGDRRWTPAYKRMIRDSRVKGTRAIAHAASQLDGKPTLISGSAIGYYGDTGLHPVDESGPPGSTFLADVVRQWEEAARPAQEAGARVVFARTGLVVSTRGGAFAKLIKLARLGLGGRLGSGRQLWSCIALVDAVAALRHCIDADLEGPVNLVTPEPLPNRDIMRTLRKTVGRPNLGPAPSFALRALIGEFADEILASQGVLPGRLAGTGFTWRAPTFGEALELALSSDA